MHRILLLAATLFAATVPAAPPAYVPVGSETGVRGTATGFFHVEILAPQLGQ